MSGIERGKLPPQTQPNPINLNLKVGYKDKHEEVKAMTILRNGREIDKNSPLVTKKSKETLVDFTILDYQPILYPSFHTPIILGRPFLAIANAFINYRNGRMQLIFGSMTLELNIFLMAKQSHEDDDYAYMNLIGAVVQEEFNKNCFFGPLETLLNNYVGSYDLECDIHASKKIFFIGSLTSFGRTKDDNN